MEQSRNIIFCDCEAEEIKDLAEGLRDQTGLEWTALSRIANWGRSSRWSELRRYLTYFTAPFGVFLHRKQYDYILGWQQFYALVFCYYCELFSVKKCNTVAVLNFTYKEKKGLAGKLYFRFMKKAVGSRYLDYLHVPSYEYAQICAETLGVDIGKFIVSPFGVPDLFEKYRDSEAPEQGYALAIGRSNRDYDWLISEWEGIDYPLVIICDTLKTSVQNPNIRIIRDVSGDAQYPYIRNCRVMILPIKDEKLCSGDTVLLTALSMEKTVIVNAPSTLAEMYLSHRENGLLVSKEKNQLRSLVREALEDGIDLGKSARRSYLERFSRYAMGKAIGSGICRREPGSL